MVKIKIHRGTNQIGGSIIEIYTENTHIFIDFGSELNASPEDSTDTKMIEMIQQAPCDAVLFSHYHGDHIGLMQYIPQTDVRGKKILLGMGKESRNVLTRIHKTLSSDSFDENMPHKEMLVLLCDEERWMDFKNREAFLVGDFTITPVRVDHSAYDAYLFILQAEGKTIVHTGDYRTHGRLGKNLFPNLTAALAQSGAAGKVDILLTEGTMMRQLEEQDFSKGKALSKGQTLSKEQTLSNEQVLSEEQLQKRAEDLLRQAGNECAFLLCSSTNVESMASFCNAANALGRRFYVNHYVYEQIEGYRKSAGTEDWALKFIGAYPFESPRYVNPKLDGGKTQLQFMKDHGGVMMIGATEAYQYRMNFFKDSNPLLIYSMWHGFVDPEKYPDTYNEKYGNLLKNWRHVELHTSGHADAQTIREMILTVHPNQGIIPIHTTQKHQFKYLQLGEVNVIELEDGDAYEV